MEKFSIIISIIIIIGETNRLAMKIGHFTVVYLVAKPLIWSKAEGDSVVIEASI